MQELESKYPDGLPLLDPVEDIGIQDPSLTAAARKVAALEQRLATNAVHKSAAGNAARWVSGPQSSTIACVNAAGLEHVLAAALAPATVGRCHICKLLQAVHSPTPP